MAGQRDADGRGRRPDQVQPFARGLASTRAGCSASPTATCWWRRAIRRRVPGGGITGWVMGRLMAKAGAGVPSANRITLLRDADGNGVAETRSAC